MLFDFVFAVVLNGNSQLDVRHPVFFFFDKICDFKQAFVVGFPDGTVVDGPFGTDEEDTCGKGWLICMGFKFGMLSQPLCGFDVNQRVIGG